MADGQLAQGNQGAPCSTVRCCPCSRRRWTDPTYPRHGRPASARRGSLGDRRASLNRRTQILSFQPACRDTAQATRQRHQGALGLRAGPSATQGRAWPRPLRRAIMARAAPTLPHVHDRARLPAIPTAQTGQGGKKESQAPRHNPASQQCAKLSSTHSLSPHQCDVRIAAGPLILKKCQSSARVQTHSTPECGSCGERHA